MKGRKDDQRSIDNPRKGGASSFRSTLVSNNERADYSRAIGSPERGKGLLTHLLAYFLTYFTTSSWKKVGPLLKTFHTFFHTCVSPVHTCQTRRRKGGREGGERVSTPLLFFNLAIVMVMHSVSFTRSRGGEGGGGGGIVSRARIARKGCVVVVRHGCTCAPLWSRKDCSNFKGGLFYEHFNPTESNTG